MKKRVLYATVALFLIVPLISHFSSAQTGSPVTNFFDGLTSVIDKIIGTISSFGWLEPVMFKKILLLILIGIVIYQGAKAFYEAFDAGNETVIIIVSEIVGLLIFTTIPASQIDYYLLSLKTAGISAMFLFLFIGAALLSAKVSSIKQAKGLWWFFVIIFAIFAIYRLPAALQSGNKIETTILIIGIIAGLLGKSLVPKIRAAAEKSQEKEQKINQRISNKYLPIVILSAISLLLCLSLVSAQIASSQLENYGNQLENAQNTVNSIATKGNAASSGEYLTKAWIEFFKGNKFVGPPIKAIDKLLVSLNPLLKVILQSDYTTSPGEFLISLTLWILLIGIMFTVAGSFIEKNSLGLLTSIILASLLGVIGIINSVSNAIYVALPAALQASIFAIVLGLIVILVVLFTYGHKFSKKIFKKAKEKLREEEEEEEFEYKKGMRRGGEWGGKSKFVRKDVAERYARRYGDDAAKERFS